MDEPALPFEQLLDRARTGDNEAIGQLFTLYSDHVRRIVRRMLHERMRRQYDSLDFVQSVWLSFLDLSRHAGTFKTAEELVAFLSKIAYNKVIETTRKKFNTQKRDLDRERSLDEIPPGQDDPLANLLPGRSATPSQYAIADERWELIVEGLSPGHRRVMELLRDGYSQSEISRLLGVDLKLIQRLRNRQNYYLDKP
jgi:RNA polymerase sigma factor (sigma-70 family)